MEPYVRDSSPPSRIWSRVSIATSIVCLAIAVGAVLWARAEVQHARADAARPTRSMPASQPMPALQPAQAAAEPPASASQPVAAEPPAPHAAAEQPAQQVAGDQAPPVATEPAQPQPAVAEPAPVEHDMTELTVRTRPAGATVTYNGEVLGTTPLVVKVNRNERGTLRIRAPGMQSEARRILPKHATKTIRVTLKPRR